MKKKYRFLFLFLSLSSFLSNLDDKFILCRHGEKCAGVIAAVANNSNCGVGLAYNAKLGGEINELIIIIINVMIKYILATFVLKASRFWGFIKEPTLKSI